MPKIVYEIDSALSENLRIAKSELEAAKKKVEDAEGLIYLAAKPHLQDKGTTHVTGVKIVTGFYEKWNDDQLAELEQRWPTISNVAFPFKKTFKADGKSITYLRENAKATYDVLADALTLTPKKPSFDLE